MDIRLTASNKFACHIAVNPLNCVYIRKRLMHQRVNYERLASFIAILSELLRRVL